MLHLSLLQFHPPNLDQVRVALNDMIEASHRTANAIDGIRGLFTKTDQPRHPVDVNEIALDAFAVIAVRVDGLRRYEQPGIRIGNATN